MSNPRTAGSTRMPSTQPSVPVSIAMRDTATGRSSSGRQPTRSTPSEAESQVDHARGM